MKNIQRKKIDIVQNILIVVLFSITILLLSFLWGEKALEDFILPRDTDENQMMESKDVIVPHKIIISQGEGDFKLIEKKKAFWNEQLLKTIDYIRQLENRQLEEITEEQYKKALDLPSVVAQFKYGIEARDFRKIFSFDKNIVIDNNITIKEIGFSQADEKCVFIKDSIKNKYYRLIADVEIVKFIKDNKGKSKNNKSYNLDKLYEEYGEENGETYYELKSFLGEKSENETLIPLELPEKSMNIRVEKFLEVAQEKKQDVIAEKFFGKRLDFVRKIQEADGTVIYMYGFGQKVLIINPKGYIEYKEDVKDDSNDYTMAQSLEEALNFISMRSLTNEYVNKKELPIPRLIEVKKNPNQKNNYRFKLTFEIGQSLVYGEENQPLEINVKNGQVDYYREELFKVEQDIRDLIKIQGISAMDVLSQNYKMINNVINAKSSQKTNMTKQPLSNDKNITFEETANKIKNMEISYLHRNESNKLNAVWKVECEDDIFYFDLKDGTPIIHEKR